MGIIYAIFVVILHDEPASKYTSNGGVVARVTFSWSSKAVFTIVPIW